MSTAMLRARARGALLGLAFGDVVGCPVESLSASAIKQSYGRYAALPAAYAPTTDAKRLAHERPLGLHSDDTQQALALLLATTHTSDPTVFADILVRGARQHAWRGTGRHFDAAIKALQSGVGVTQSGQASGGIGAAMRVVPAALVPHDDVVAMNACLTTCAVTHRDVHAITIACTIAQCARDWLRADDDTATVQRQLHQLPDKAREIEALCLKTAPDACTHVSDVHAVSRVLADVLPKVAVAGPLAIDDAVTLLADATVAHATPLLDAKLQHKTVHACQGAALLGGVFALAASLLPHPPRDVVFGCVRLGEDTDTVAAIVGALLGCRYGDGFIETHPMRDAFTLRGYAEALVTVVSNNSPQRAFVAPEPIDSFLLREATWTRRERQFQEHRKPSLQPSLL